jgi:RHS repeat-associated protein
MNGSALQKYIDPTVAGMAAVHNGPNGQPPNSGYFQHADWLGSSWLGVTASGTVQYDRAYAPFGEPYDESSTTNRTFTGQTEDTTAGLYDFLFRQQSQAQGRWLVPDPAGLAAVDITNPQTWNRYAYVGNNPLNSTDRLGLYMDVCPVGYYGGDCSAPPEGGGGGIVIPCWWCRGAGGGGGGGTGGGGGQPPRQSPTHFPNETLGLPNGFPTNPWGIVGAIIPSANCGDITCVSIGNGIIDPANLGKAAQTSIDLIVGLTTTIGGLIWDVGWTNDTRRLFDTKWCGPGGGGTPDGAVDSACMQHDLCYDAAGVSSKDTGRVLSQAKAAAVQACNQQLCNAVRSTNTSAGRLINWYFSTQVEYKCQ